MSRPLRFAFVTTFYPPFNFGGDGIAVQGLARALVRRGHHVTVVHDVDAYNLLHDGPEPTLGPIEDGVEVISLRSGVGALSCLLTQQTGRPVVNGGRIRRILDEGRFDVVNFHNVSLVGGPGILTYGGDAIRIYTAHEHWLVCPTHVLWRHRRELCDGRECLRCQLAYRRPPQLWRWTGFMERQLRAIDAFLAMSEFSRDKHREFGFPHEMEVLPYFTPEPGEDAHVDSARPHARPYFLFVGRLEQIKGLDEVIPLFRSYPDADLLVAGEGGHGPALRALAEGCPRVRFLGWVPSDELTRYYEHALALIVPSVCYETFGIIIIEAFRHGVPVLARRLGPFPELVEGADAGELFETPSQLMAAMRRLQDDQGLRDRWSQNARSAFLDRWTEEAVVTRYLEIVARAGARRGRRLPTLTLETA